MDSASPVPFSHLAQVFHRGNQGMKIGAQYPYKEALNVKKKNPSFDSSMSICAK